MPLDPWKTPCQELRTKLMLGIHARKHAIQYHSRHHLRWSRKEGFYTARGVGGLQIPRNHAWMLLTRKGLKPSRGEEKVLEMHMLNIRCRRLALTSRGALKCSGYPSGQGQVSFRARAG